MKPFWNSVDALDLVASPGLLVDVDAIARNIQAMVRVVGGEAARLRPHVKTHKMPSVIQMQVDAGITQFKAATIAEAWMVAGTGGTDVLVAYPIVGRNIQRLRSLRAEYLRTKFSVLVDDASAAVELADSITDEESPLPVFIDVDCGMHRTGIGWGQGLNELRHVIDERSELLFAGLHVYDGHLHQPGLNERQAAVHEIMTEVEGYVSEFGAPEVIAGGSPTFAIWATESNFVCSPGTTLFWDVGYGENYPDLPFEIAAAVLTRVISKPGGDRVCIDLGYKSIAAEMPLERRVRIPEVPDARWIGHSEEHLVFETSAADSLAIGQPLIAFPRHICPTVALHDWANVIRDGAFNGERWPVTARSR